MYDLMNWNVIPTRFEGKLFPKDNKFFFFLVKQWHIINNTMEKSGYYISFSWNNFLSKVECFINSQIIITI